MRTPCQVLSSGETLLTQPQGDQAAEIVRQSQDWWTEMVCQHISSQKTRLIKTDLHTRTHPGMICVGKTAPDTAKVHVSTAPFAAGAASRPDGSVPTLIAGYDFLVVGMMDNGTKNKSTIFLATTPEHCSKAVQNAVLGDKILVCPSFEKLAPEELREYDVTAIGRFGALNVCGGNFSFLAAQAISIALSSNCKIKCSVDSGWPACYKDLPSLSREDAKNRSSAMFDSFPPANAISPSTSSPWLGRLLSEPVGVFLEVGFSIHGVASALASAGWTSLTIEPSAPLCKTAEAQRRGEVRCAVVTPSDGDINQGADGFKVGQSLPSILSESPLKFSLLIFNSDDYRCLSFANSAQLPRFVQINITKSNAQKLSENRDILPSFTRTYTSGFYYVFENPTPYF